MFCQPICVKIDWHRALPLVEKWNFLFSVSWKDYSHCSNSHWLSSYIWFFRTYFLSIWIFFFGFERIAFDKRRARRPACSRNLSFQLMALHLATCIRRHFPNTLYKGAEKKETFLKEFANGCHSTRVVNRHKKGDPFNRRECFCISKMQIGRIQDECG